MFEILNYNAWYAIYVNFIFSVFFGLMFSLRGPQGQNPRTTWVPWTTVWKTLRFPSELSGTLTPVLSKYEDGFENTQPRSGVMLVFTGTRGTTSKCVHYCRVVWKHKVKWRKLMSSWCLWTHSNSRNFKRDLSVSIPNHFNPSPTQWRMRTPQTIWKICRRAKLIFSNRISTAITFFSVSYTSHYSKSTHLIFWLRNASTSLTFNNCTFCPHCIDVLCKQRLVPLTA
jgi:hypothetical protein